MPVGVMQWFDDKNGEGRIAQRGRLYPTSLADRVDTNARAPGVRVHFDITRLNGVERATNVSAQIGTRTSHRHRRHGDQSGAHDMAANAPSKTERFTDLGLDRERRPRQVVVEVARRLGNGDLASARPLLAPDVVLHFGRAGGTDRPDARGTAAVFDVLAESVVSASGAFPVNITLLEDEATVDWIVDRRLLRARVKVARGQVTEIWWDLAEPTSAPAEQAGADAPEIHFLVNGPVKRGAVDYARGKVRGVLATAPPPVLFARVKLLQHTDPAATKPAAAEATIDLNGRLMRASAGADTMHEAIDLLDRHLRDRLGHLRHTGGDERALHSHTGRARPRGSLTGRPSMRRLAHEDRRIVRNKTIADDAMTIDEALWDLEQLDYDFYLFADLETGQDALLARGTDGQVEVLLADAGAPNPSAPGPDVVVSSVPTPTLNASSAKEWIDSTDQPFLFYRDDETGRGTVLYRRIDGDYGLLSF